MVLRNGNFNSHYRSMYEQISLIIPRHVLSLKLFPPVKPSSSNATKKSFPDSALESQLQTNLETNLQTIWVVETSEVESYKRSDGQDVTQTLVGAFSSKATAIENAKVSITNLSNLSEDLFGPDGRMVPEDDLDLEGLWEEVEDNSDTVGEEGGVLFKLHGDSNECSVSIKKVLLNQPIKKN